ncbi:MAG: GNAT family N-acetyltransferase [Boseongicola sp.]|nr:MAG: GNAT family N-acetyltransferase [Boseongicola sp.]
MTPQLTDTPVLETERLILRAPHGDDLPHWTELAVSDRSKFIGGPYTQDMAFRAWAGVIGHWAIRGFGMFVLEPKGGGDPVGHLGHWQPEGWPEREIGWCIWSSKVEGKGFAFEAARAVCEYTFQILKWDTAVSYIDDGNQRSEALAARLGAIVDPDAPKPDKDWPPINVYRHSVERWQS